ncbi:hypothetical protein PPYR_12934 [Photinus pyralis]|uniref:HECT domain-containing protein n=2 Tax=Photinus pyralis TaxID=7054 RepID=A0A5N4A7L6_PHOPY|nr:hypothetical protein PPYR_12934 [Photinus pyralis]
MDKETSYHLSTALEEFLIGRNVAEDTLNYLRLHKVLCSVVIEDDDSMQPSSTKPRNGKNTRLIKLGWFHYNETFKEPKQVRAINGGGSRDVRVPKYYNKQDIIDEGCNLFFPNGTSSKGLKLSDMNTTLLDFCAKELEDEVMTIEQMFQTAKITRLHLYLCTTPKKRKEVCETVTSETADTRGTSDTMYGEVPTQLSSDLTEFQCSYNIEDFLCLPPDAVVANDRLLATQIQNEENDGFILSLEQNTENTPVTPVSPTADISICLHRGRVFEELINIFLERRMVGSKIHVTLMLPNGELECAEDLGGVWRDALSEFWNSMYEKCTIGTNIKVPQLRHDFGVEKWSAIAEVLKQGWITDKYFPIRLSKCFMEYTIFKQCSGDVTTDFFGYISEDDKTVFREAIGHFESIPTDELLDVLGRYDCKTLAKEDNIKQIIDELAHQEILQKSAFISDCFNKVLVNLVDVNEFNEIYRTSNPTSRNILAALLYDDNLSEEAEKVSAMLKRYIREAPENIRMAFLRFATGADILLGNKIKIIFSKSDGFSRRPIAHTCTNTLEVPDCYDNFMEFRSEFNCILTSNIWIMDIF